MVESWVKDLVESVGPKPLEIGKRYKLNGNIVEITGGQFWGTHGVSNFWYWRIVNPDGTLSKEEYHGYRAMDSTDDTGTYNNFKEI